LQRFSEMERWLAERGRTLKQLTAKEQLLLWQQVKTT
jgi:hypothetical protein